MARPKKPDAIWVIDNVLGGTTEASKLLGIKPQAVSNMKAVNRFPERHHYTVFKACQAAGVTYDPSAA